MFGFRSAFTTFALLFIVSRYEHNSLLQSVWRAKFCRGTVLQPLWRDAWPCFRRPEPVTRSPCCSSRGRVLRPGPDGGNPVRRILDSSHRRPRGCDHRASSDMACERDFRFGWAGNDGRVPARWSGPAYVRQRCRGDAGDFRLMALRSFHAQLSLPGDTGEDDFWDEGYGSLRQPYLVWAGHREAFCEVAVGTDHVHRLHHGCLHPTQARIARPDSRNAGTVVGSSRVSRERDVLATPAARPIRAGILAVADNSDILARSLSDLNRNLHACISAGRCCSVRA